MSSELVVAKFGSEIVVSDAFDTQERLNVYAETLLAQHEPNKLIIVSSGAVAQGGRFILEAGEDPERFSLQEKAQLGGSAIAEAWREAFREHGKLAGGLYVTHNEINKRKEGARLESLLRKDRKRSIVPIINENDAISITELMELATGGDNDGLAAHIARKVGASGLMLFTNRGGIFDENKQIIREVTRENHPAIKLMLRERAELDAITQPRSDIGRGGIVSKDKHAYRFSRKYGWSLISPAPLGTVDRDNSTYYGLAA